MFDLTGKKTLITGVANKDSLAFGIAKAAASQGAETYLTYQNEKLWKRVKPLLEQIGGAGAFQCDVSSEDDMNGLAAWVEDIGPIDALVHSIAFAGREQLKGPYLLCVTREAYLSAMELSAWSFTALVQKLYPHLREEASIMALTFYASQRVWANYNVMAQDKAALECAVRTIAVELGPLGIRVNSISASATPTLAAKGIADEKRVGGISEAMSPLGRLASQDEVGAVGVYLMSDASKCITGTVVPANCGVEITAHAPHQNASKMEEEMGLVSQIDYPIIGSDREGVRLRVAKAKQSK